MNITEEQRESMLKAAMPLIEWLKENAHPHCYVLVDSDSAELLEGIARANDSDPKGGGDE